MVRTGFRQARQVKNSHKRLYRANSGGSNHRQPVHRFTLRSASLLSFILLLVLSFYISGFLFRDPFPHIKIENDVFEMFD